MGTEFLSDDDNDRLILSLVGSKDEAGRLLEWAHQMRVGNSLVHLLIHGMVDVT